MVGTEETRLIVLRGNSASGKSTIAARLRDRFGRNLALVGQDNLRRTVLRERDRPGAANIGLIGMTARYALDAGFHTVVEGILYADRYAGMLEDLVREHRGISRYYYLDVPLQETLVRHATKPDRAYLAQVTEEHLREWYRERDLLPSRIESVFAAGSTLDETVERILRETGLDQVAPVDR
ncbi:AAA family ATPase [Streptomyces sp. NPDC056084]|uniref:AAA family ATPase n=1 Tax=unclassified Streptomyces TaxID=2593676 RepID=UPI0035DD4D9E